MTLISPDWLGLSAPRPSVADNKIKVHLFRERAAALKSEAHASASDEASPAYLKLGEISTAVFSAAGV
jgi:hypothetical protein